MVLQEVLLQPLLVVWSWWLLCLLCWHLLPSLFTCGGLSELTFQTYTRHWILFYKVMNIDISGVCIEVAWSCDTSHAGSMWCMCVAVLIITCNVRVNIYIDIDPSNHCSHQLMGCYMNILYYAGGWSFLNPQEVQKVWNSLLSQTWCWVTATSLIQQVHRQTHTQTASPPPPPLPLFRSKL